MPVHLLALEKAAKPVSASDSAMRSAVVKVANYYLRMAQSKSPAQMEAIIWGSDSVDGADHGQSCAAFASLTLALGAQAAGQESWVTGGTTYPWPLRQWADVRVDPNPGSPEIVSVLQDAQAHHRWHPLGDGYQPQPGDWVMFEGHVEVVTRYSAGVLRTIGGDSGPDLSVNAHAFTGPLAGQGVTGFVNNGELLSGAAGSGQAAGSAQDGGSAQVQTAGVLVEGRSVPAAPDAGGAAVPGTGTAALTPGSGRAAGATSGRAAGATGGRAATARKGTTTMVGTAGRAGSVGTQSMVAMPGLMADAGMVTGNGAMAGTGGAAGARAVSGASGGTARGGGGAARAGGGAARGGAEAGQRNSARAGAAAGQGNSARAGSRARAASQPRPGASAQPARAGTASRAGTAAGAGTATGAGSAARTRAGMGARTAKGPRAGAAAIPGLPPAAADTPSGVSSPAGPSYTRNEPPAAHVPDTSSQQTFISEVAPGAMAAQSRYGIPAAVTIAQAIDESGWGQSALAVRDHNLFGIKGTGPAGTDMLPTREYENGQWVTRSAPFRVYHNVAESIADHSQLLATGASYQHAMADRHLPDAFAADLTGVYATDPQYGSNLIAIMRLYNLYRYSASAPAAPQSASGTQAGMVSTGGSGGTGGTGNTGGTVSASGAGSQGGITGQGSVASPQAEAGHGGTAGGGAATIPGVLDAYTTGPARPAPAAAQPVKRAPQASRPAARVAPRRARTQARDSRYVPQIPRAVTTAFITTAKAPLSRAEPLYDDVARRSGIRWELLAACDWMQCQAQPRYSPVYGEKLGTVNAGGTTYRTKSEALGQCASDLIELAMAVYWLDITARRPLSVRDLAKVFAAFRWGGLLKLHGISAMEFPYSVEGLTAQHVKMRWPDVKEPKAPDKPGTRFRMPFGAVPVVLCLGYPAIA